MEETELKTPWPYPGGKSRVADEVWSRIGDVANWIEPFAGSLAVTLRRPASHFMDGYRIETVNDANRYIVNFWRSVQADPEAVARFADWPVHEADLHARHRWLMRSDEADAWRAMMVADPTYYDPKIAGWWAWGQCCWIGSGWCNEEFVEKNKMPQCSNGGIGPGGRPQLADAFDIGRGVNGNGNLHAKRPNFPGVNTLGTGLLASPAHGTCSGRREWLIDWMARLSDRLRLVRTCYGHWNRVCNSDSTLTRLGTTGVFLDPPYPLKSTSGKKSRAKHIYATDGEACLDTLRDEVLQWCLEWGEDKKIRVAVCGYEGDGYEPLLEHGWTEFAWEANGGYANQSGGKAENAKRERIWFSPHCISADDPSLFAGIGEDA